MRELPQFKEGTEVEVEVTEEGFTVRRAAPKKRLTLPFSETELLRNLTPESAHADAVAEPLANELGD
jgi:antitoxin MazE